MPLSTSLFLAACQDRKAAVLPPMPATNEGPARVEAGVMLEKFRVDEAMTMKDVSFALRAGMSEAELLKEITERGLLEVPDEAAVKQLAIHGATPQIIAYLRDPRFQLTANERTHYREREQRRGKANAGLFAAQRELDVKEQAERQRMQQLQTVSLKTVADQEAKKKDYEEAKEQYESRKRRLDEEIQLKQASISRYRSYGWREQELAASLTELKRLQEQRQKLKAP